MCQNEHVDSTHFTVRNVQKVRSLVAQTGVVNIIQLGKKTGIETLLTLRILKKKLSIKLLALSFCTVLSVHSVCCRSFSLSLSLYPPSFLGGAHEGTLRHIV
jgi:hypothetical protein